MKAAFLYAVRYSVQAHCLTPLRTGGADGDAESILTGSDGQAMIQGTSLSGAMRSWVTAHRGEAAAEGLFGSQKAAGSLVISDGTFSADAQIGSRPRLRMSGATGSAAHGGKFDLAQVNAGSCFSFEVVYLGSGADDPLLFVTEEMLFAMNSGLILLGGQKSNGFGRVALTVEKQVYDMCSPKDRRAWLDDVKEGAPLPMQPILDEHSVVFTLTGHMDRLLIKAAAVQQVENRNVTVHLCDGDRPVLPGSSVKGAVRARAALIAGGVGFSGELMDRLFGKGAEGGTGDAVPGVLRFGDIQLEGETRQKISRIRINRFTGGVIRQGLFTEEPLTVPVTLTVRAPADDFVGCALLLYALRDLGLGLYSLGSGASIGRGVLRAQQLEVTGPGSAVSHLKFDGGLSCTAEDPSGLLKKWMTAWKEAIS